METLKNKERATIKDLVEVTKKLSNEQRKQLLYIGFGMGLSNGLAGGVNDKRN